MQFFLRYMAVKKKLIKRNMSCRRIWRNFLRPWRKNEAKKPKVAFICVHNSCRSQMAEAISKVLAFDAFEAYSAGTKTKAHINSDAVDIVMELYGVDMRETQKAEASCRDTFGRYRYHPWAVMWNARIFPVNTGKTGGSKTPPEREKANL